MGAGKTSSDPRIVRRNPKRGESSPANGEASATATVGALTVSAASPLLAPKICSKSGSSGIEA